MEISLDTLVDELSAFERAYRDTRGETKKIRHRSELRAEFEKVKRYVEVDLGDKIGRVEDIRFGKLPKRKAGEFEYFDRAIIISRSYKTQRKQDPRIYHYITHEAVHGFGLPSYAYTYTFAKRGFNYETATELYSFEIDSVMAFDGDANHGSGLYSMIAGCLFVVAYTEAEQNNKETFLIDNIRALYSRSKLRKYIKDVRSVEESVVSNYAKEPYLRLKEAMKRPDRGVVGENGEPVFYIPNLVDFWNKTIEKYRA